MIHCDSHYRRQSSFFLHTILNYVILFYGNTQAQHKEFTLKTVTVYDSGFVSMAENCGNPPPPQKRYIYEYIFETHGLGI